MVLNITKHRFHRKALCCAKIISFKVGNDVSFLLVSGAFLSLGPSTMKKSFYITHCEHFENNNAVNAMTAA